MIRARHQVLRNRERIVETTTHELGHLIGLGHSSDPMSIMYSNPYNSIAHTLEDDIEACRNMYGYSNVYTPIDTYTPPAAGVNTYANLFISTFNTWQAPFNSDDGTLDADDTIINDHQVTSFD